MPRQKQEISPAALAARERIFPSFTAADAQRPVCFLSSGAGQDSFALHVLAAYSGTFRNRFIGESDFAVVHADTGAEHQATYDFITDTLRPFSERWNIPFYYVTRDLEYHTGHWRNGLRAQYRATNSIGMMTTRSCTDSAKIAPLYKWVDEYLGRRYGFEWGDKRALRAYTARFGKLRVMIGFAAGEEKRVAKPAPAVSQTELDLGKEHKGKPKGRTPAWMRDCVERVYPLIDLGMDRAACQEYTRSTVGIVPRPSLCTCCHFKSPEELTLYSMTDPEGFADWVQLEANKIAKWADLERNPGAKGAKLLPEVVAETYGTLRPRFESDAALREYLEEYAFSHGHCVSTSY